MIVRVTVKRQNLGHLAVTRACKRGKDRDGTLAGEKLERWALGWVAIVAGAVAGGCALCAIARKK